MDWQEILTIVVPLAGFMGWVYSRIDKRFEEMRREFKFNFEEMRKEFKYDFEKIDQRFERIEERFNRIEKDLSSLTTRVAVIESRLSDISTNVTHLMWHQQTLPQQEAKEE